MGGGERGSLFFGSDSSCSLSGEESDCLGDDAFALLQWCQGGPTHVSRRSCVQPESELVCGFGLSRGSVWTGWEPAIGFAGPGVCVTLLGG